MLFGISVMSLVRLGKHILQRHLLFMNLKEIFKQNLYCIWSRKKTKEKSSHISLSGFGLNGCLYF